MTAAEAKEIDFRQTVIATDAPKIRRYVEQSGLTSTFAGLVMDNQTGKLVVTFSESVSTPLRVLPTIVTFPDRLVVRTAARPYGSLVSMQKEVDTLRDNTEPRIAATAIDEAANRLRVDVTAAAEEMQAALDKRFGVGSTRVELASARPVGTTAANSPPFRGGQKISDIDGYTCTSGFVAKYSTTYYLISAGHCGIVGKTWNQSGVPIGTTDNAVTVGADVMRIPINKNFRSNSVTIEYSSYLGQGTYRAITSSQARNADVVGEMECYSGINTTSLQCGPLKTKTFSINGTLDDGRSWQYSTGREADFDCNPGDSGGSALYNNQARGLISAKITRSLGNDTCVYVHIWDALSRGGLSAVVTGAT